MPVFSPIIPVMSVRYLTVLFFIVVITTLSFLTALCLGSADISIIDIINMMSGNETGLKERIVLEIRLPRVQTGMYVGGMLALAGCLMQILLRNPLADPYILGVSGGASVFAL